MLFLQIYSNFIKFAIPARNIYLLQFLARNMSFIGKSPLVEWYLWLKNHFFEELLKIFLKIFGHIKKSLYICTRNSAP